MPRRREQRDERDDGQHGGRARRRIVVVEEQETADTRHPRTSLAFASGRRPSWWPPATVGDLEYTLTGPEGAYRLVTTILDLDQSPAAELAAHHAQRMSVPPVACTLQLLRWKPSPKGPADSSEPTAQPVERQLS